MFLRIFLLLAFVSFACCTPILELTAPPRSDPVPAQGEDPDDDASRDGGAPAEATADVSDARTDE